MTTRAKGGVDGLAAVRVDDRRHVDQVRDARAKMTRAVIEPATTLMARLWVATTSATMTSMTMVSPSDIRLRADGWAERRSKVPAETRSMTATRTPIGMLEKSGPTARQGNSARIAAMAP
ncbi:hypothetical protein OHR68_13670 [Spirillospora sp. NBC_00431]